MRIDRQRLFRDTLAAFRELDWQASAPVERAMNKTPLTYTIAYRASARKLERSAAMLQVLHSLDSGFDVAPHVERHREYRERFDWARGQLVFTLVTDADSEAIGEVVQDLLSREGLQSELVTDGACREICVEISSRATSRYAARRYMSTVNAMFRVRDGEAAVSASREHQVRGTALVGYPEARSAAIRNFRTNFADEGILEALGL